MTAIGCHEADGRSSIFPYMRPYKGSLFARVGVAKFGWGGARQKRTECERERWVHPQAESAHNEKVAASRCKFRNIEENKDAAFIDVPSWMWAV